MQGARAVLVTGGCGFIGRTLCERLSRDGHRVRVLDSLAEQIHGSAPDLSWLSRLRVEFLHGSVSEPKWCERAVKGVDAVVHLAAETGTGQSMYEMRRYVDTNIGGTASLLEQCQRGGVKKLVLSSSRAVYGEGTWSCKRCGLVHPSLRQHCVADSQSWNPACPKCGGVTDSPAPTSESCELKPTSVYGMSKVAQEHLVTIAQLAGGLTCEILRFFNVFGPGQALTNPYTGVLGVFLNRARAGKPIEVYEDGEILRDFVYVDDVIKAIGAALNARSTGPINVGSGAAVSILGVAEEIVRMTGSRSPVVLTGKTRAGDVRGLVADRSRARSQLHWEPSVGFHEGLEKFIEWANATPTTDRYDESMAELRARGLYR